jgi:hypothetical protein
MEVRASAPLGALLGLSIAGWAVAAGCGTGAVDVEGCRRIEEARCHQAPTCNLPIEPPYFTTDGTVDACVRFYDDACLHGLAVNDPGAAALNACVAAIEADTLGKDGCATVKAPPSDPACAWLAPSSAPDAAAEATADAADGD